LFLKGKGLHEDREGSNFSEGGRAVRPGLTDRVADGKKIRRVEDCFARDDCECSNFFEGGRAVRPGLTDRVADIKSSSGRGLLR
jgi:hypothetical protein